MNDNISEKAKQYLYYIIIAILSIAFTVFLPMVGSEGQITANFPNSVTGWIIWSIVKLCTAILNVVIFYCFMEQAMLNISKNELYIEANKLLSKTKSVKKRIPRSPVQYKKLEYTKKALTIFLFTALALVGLENMVLRWKLEVFLTYIFTIVFGLIFGILQMKKAEIYWTVEYNEYAHYIIEKESKNE